MSVDTIRPGWAALLVLLFSLSTNLIGAEQYKVRLTRPYKVGYEFDTEATVSSKRAVGETVTSFSGQLYGTIKVLAVNEKTGGVTQLQCTVVRLTRDGKEIYEGGVVIVAQKVNYQDVITVNGQPAPAETVEVLDPMLNLSDPTSTVSDDQAGGTDQPQPVGVAWPINKRYSAQQALESGLHISPSTVSGESKITKIRSAAGSDAMVVHMIETYQIAPHKLPGKVPILGGSVTMTEDLVLPVDIQQPMLSMTGDEHLSEILLKHGQITVTHDIHMTRSDQPKK